MFEQIRRARWKDVTDLLGSGHPPLYIQLLVVNAAFLLYFIVRRLFTKPPTDRLKLKKKPRYRAEILVLATNAAILYEHSWLPYFDGPALKTYWHTLMNI